MPSSVWTGHLTFGLISMPVRLFSGARSSHISFHMLDRKDNARVRQQLVSSADGRVVPRNETVKGFEYSKDQYVILDPAEIKKIEPKTAKTMEIIECVKADEIDPVYFDASYYLMPEEAGKKAYALLSKALQDTNYVAIAKLTMHNREYTVFLRPRDGGIMLHTMYYANEVQKVKDFGKPDVQLKDVEVKIAHQLIKALEAKFEPEKFADRFEENLKQMIEARLEGKEVVSVEAATKHAPVVDLMAALKESLKAAEQKKPPSRAGKEATIHVVEKKEKEKDKESAKTAPPRRRAHKTA